MPTQTYPLRISENTIKEACQNQNEIDAYYKAAKDIENYINNEMEQNASHPGIFLFDTISTATEIEKRFVVDILQTLDGGAYGITIARTLS